MKFKNYRNSKTDDNRIYTTKEIKNMTLGEIFRRKDEILAQNRAIGVPSESELRGSENVVYVHEYEREDGTRVRAHWRSKCGGGKPEEKQKDVNVTGGAAEIGNSDIVLHGGVKFNDFIEVVDEALGTPAKNAAEILETVKEGFGKALGTGKIVAEKVIQNVKSEQLPRIQEIKIKQGKPDVVKKYPEQEYYKIAYDLKKAKQNGKVPEWIFDHNIIQKVKNIKNKKLNDFVKNKLYKSIKPEHNNGDVGNIDDIYVVAPKYDSTITEIIKKDSAFIDKIKNNIDAIKDGEYKNKAMSYNFNSSKFMSPLDSEKHFSTHNTIGLCDIYDIKIDSDGYVSMIIVDYYDFDKSGNIIVNNAYQKQIEGNLENYVLLIPIRFKLEDI